MTWISTIILIALGIPAHSLLCYESNYLDFARARNNTAFEYCVMAPYGLKEDSSVILYGVTKEEDSTQLYDTVFKAVNGPFSYSVLTMCIFEKYKMGDNPAEFVFRCFCKQDLCNKAVNIQSYVDRLVDTNK